MAPSSGGAEGRIRECGMNNRALFRACSGLMQRRCHSFLTFRMVSWRTSWCKSWALCWFGLDKLTEATIHSETDENATIPVGSMGGDHFEPPINQFEEPVDAIQDKPYAGGPDLQELLLLSAGDGGDLGWLHQPTLPSHVFGSVEAAVEGGAGEDRSFFPYNQFAEQYYTIQDDFSDGGVGQHGSTLMRAGVCGDTDGTRRPDPEFYNIILQNGFNVFDEPYYKSRQSFHGKNCTTSSWWMAGTSCLAGCGLQRCFNALLGTRIGEAKNPGPANPVFNFEELGLKEIIKQYVLEAIKEAFQSMGLSCPTPSTPSGSGQQPGATRPQEEDQRQGAGKDSVKDKGKGKRSGKDRSSTSHAPSQPRFPPSDEAPSHGRGACRNGKSEPEGRKKTRPSTGKGKGNKPNKDNVPDGWTKVEPRKPRETDQEFKVRQQDWSDPIIYFADLGKKIEAHNKANPFRGVLLCSETEAVTATSMLKGAGTPFSVLIVFLKKSSESVRIPGCIGDTLRFREAVVQQLFSDGQSAPQPKYIQAVSTKIAKKTTCVVFVRVPKPFAEKSIWEAFAKTPQTAIVKWLSKHHIQCSDTWGWKEEQDRQKDRQVYGCLRIAEDDFGALIGLSGMGGVFIEAPQEKGAKYAVQWIAKIKNENESAYLSRASLTKGDCGLVCRGSSLGWRSLIVGGNPIRIWRLDHAPFEWDMLMMRPILEDFFTNVTMMRQSARAGSKQFIFKGAPKAGDVDLIPICIPGEESGDSRITLWASIAPPRGEAGRIQRVIRNKAMPFVHQSSIFDPTDESAVTEVEQNAAAENGDKKEESVAKKVKVSAREILAGTQKKEIARDGNCLYTSWIAGLAHLNHAQKDVTQLELRSTVAEHLTRRAEYYKPV